MTRNTTKTVNTADIVVQELNITIYEYKSSIDILLLVLINYLNS